MRSVYEMIAVLIFFLFATKLGSFTIKWSWLKYLSIPNFFHQGFKLFILSLALFAVAASASSVCKCVSAEEKVELICDSRVFVVFIN